MIARSIVLIVAIIISTTVGYATVVDLTGSNNSGTISVTDIIAIQAFILQRASGFANTGQYQFNPVNRSYPGVVSDQTGQNYDTLVFGDVAAAFVN